MNNWHIFSTQNNRLRNKLWEISFDRLEKALDEQNHMNPYNPFKHITDEESLTYRLNEKEWEKFLKSLEPTPLESFQTNMNKIFKDTLSQLNTIKKQYE